jgi:hypothetical protein
MPSQNAGHNLSLPRHRYIGVHASFVLKDAAHDHRLLPAVWWGVSVTPGRMLGCHVLLECGALVVDLPLHALNADPSQLTVPNPLLPLQTAVWDMYGWEAELFAPTMLEDAHVTLHNFDALSGAEGKLWFAVDHVRDGYSMAPGQHKHLWVVALMGTGYLVQVPQDHLLVDDPSFTVQGPVPRIQRQERIYRAEG